jgi:hypothetical protein
MRADLEAEKMAMVRIWKKREAQLVRMSDGLLGIVGDLHGIRGGAVMEHLENVAVLPCAAVNQDF